jgi:hypothetical protein
MTHITRHARRRGKERLGLPLRALERLVPKVLQDGRTRSDYRRGRVQRYLDGLANDPLHHGKADNIRIYGEHVFLFNADTLITVLHVPHDLRSALR